MKRSLKYVMKMFCFKLLQAYWFESSIASVLYTSSKGQHFRTSFWLNENAGRDKSWPEDLPMQRRLKKPTKTNWKTMLFAESRQCYPIILMCGSEENTITRFPWLSRSISKTLFRIFFSLLRTSWKTLHSQLNPIQIIIV